MLLKNFRIRTQYERKLEKTWLFAFADGVRFILEHKIDRKWHRIGYVHTLPFIRKDMWETHSSLDSNYRGRGFGIMMYAAAFDFFLGKGKNVCSSVGPSKDAKRVWRSDRLNSKYEICERRGQFFVKSRK